MARVSVGGEEDVVYKYMYMQWLWVVFASSVGWGGSVWRGVGGQMESGCGLASRRVEFSSGWLALALSPPLLLLSSLALTLALSASPAKQPSQRRRAWIKLLTWRTLG